jgi:hypothetical protein
MKRQPHRDNHLKGQHLPHNTLHATPTSIHNKKSNTYPKESNIHCATPTGIQDKKSTEEA